MNPTVGETEEDSRQAPITEGPGHRLKSQREAENLELSRVSVLLHLSEAKLAALEADDYSSLHGPVFVQGYLRNYARLLGVPVEPILNAYHAAAPDKARVPDLKITQVSHQVRGGHGLIRLVIWGLVVGLVLLTLVWWRGYLQWPMQLPGSLDGSLTPTDDIGEPVSGSDFPAFGEDRVVGLAPAPPRAEPEPVGERAAATPDPAAEEGAVGGPVEADAPPAAESAAAGISPGPESAAVGISPGPDSAAAGISPGPESAAAGTAPAKPAAPEAAAAAADERVVLEYSGVSWTRIEDASGTFRVEGQIQAGTRQLLRGEPPYQLVLGNAAAVKIFVDGREFDLAPYSRGNVARLKLDPDN